LWKDRVRYGPYRIILTVLSKKSIDGVHDRRILFGQGDRIIDVYHDMMALMPS